MVGAEGLNGMRKRVQVRCVMYNDGDNKGFDGIWSVLGSSGTNVFGEGCSE